MQSSKPLLIHHSRFKPSSHGDGGAKRTSQVLEILEENGFNVIDLNKKSSMSLTEKISGFIYAIYFLTLTRWLLKIKGWANLFNFAKAIAVFHIRIKSILRSHKTISAFVWESTMSQFFYLPLLFKKHKIPVIALPHNIESLVDGQKSKISKKESPHFFSEELEYLTYSDQIFTISREETWLLKLFGLQSFFLPYFPVREIFNELIFIRKERQKIIEKGQKRIIMLGTAQNPPTKQGMANRLQFFKDNPMDVKLQIAGYGTENLFKNIILPKHVEMLGTLSNETLVDCLIKTDAVIIHQITTTGALTKIIELLISGVPIIANAESVRSYWGFDGIYVYNDDNQLTKMLDDYSFSEPEIPKEPSIFIQQFLDSLP